MILPQKYIDDMKKLLKDDFNNFIKIYEEKHHKGISINTKKISTDDFTKIFEKTDKIPWSKDSLYVYDDEVAKNIIYHTGSYYVQEPTATSPVNYMELKKGMKVLDMCASPGGKTFQISQKLSDEDLLISNDINNSRMPQLIRNIEYYGLCNVMITNDNQENLSKNFPNFFDAILLDAPCSGEGMFRKDKKIISSYEKSRDELISIQRDLLQKASTMVKKYGRIVYSTCTFNEDENENNIIDFLEKNKNFRLVNIPKENGIVSLDKLKECARFFPHKVNGEGHFVAVLEKISDEDRKIEYKNKQYLKKLPSEYDIFEKKMLNKKMSGNFIISNNSLYMEIFDKVLPHKLRIVRNGLYLGDIKNNSFSMSSAFIRHLQKKDIKNTIDLSENQAMKYVKGETLILENFDDEDYVVCLHDLTIGLIRIKNSKAKNMYNKNWRAM